MILPDLHAALAAEDPPAGLAAAAAAISQRYRADGGCGGLTLGTDLERLAYAAVRMPATAAAIASALTQARARLSDPTWTSLLDLGAGTGAGLWAVAAVAPECGVFTAIERDPGLIAIGRRLCARSADAVAQTTWHAADLRAPQAFASHALVTISYVLGELDPAAQTRLIAAAWAACGEALALIEPGTPRGFAAIVRARTQLIALGAQLAAPCPQARGCPLADGGQPLAHGRQPLAAGKRQPGWCHVSARVPRSRLHRVAKGASLGFEDEKFSYVVASRRPVIGSGQRVLSPVLSDKGAVRFQACVVDDAGDAVREMGVPRRDPGYRAATRLAWGDWRPQPDGELPPRV